MPKLLIIFILFFFLIILDAGLWFFFNNGGGFILLLLSAYALMGIVVGVFFALRKWLGYVIVDYMLLVIVFLPFLWMMWKLLPLLIS